MLTTLILAATLTVPGEVELKARLPDIFAKSAAHYKALDAAATPLMENATWYLWGATLLRHTEGGKMKMASNFRVFCNPTTLWALNTWVDEG